MAETAETEAREWSGEWGMGRKEFQISNFKLQISNFRSGRGGLGTWFECGMREQQASNAKTQRGKDAKGRMREAAKTGKRAAIKGTAKRLKRHKKRRI
jgi:hypothetical protein